MGLNVKHTHTHTLRPISSQISMATRVNPQNTDEAVDGAVAGCVQSDGATVTAATAPDFP